MDLMEREKMYDQLIKLADRCTHDHGTEGELKIGEVIIKPLDNGHYKWEADTHRGWELWELTEAATIQIINLLKSDGEWAEYYSRHVKN